MSVGDNIQVTEGSGKRLATGATYTENSQTVRDEKSILGENYLASYTITTSGTSGVSIATANSHPLQIMAGASLKVRVRRIEVHQATVATTVALPVFSLFRLTTAGSGGTAVTPNPLNPADSASGATAMKLPSSKGTEAAEITTAVPYFMQTLAASNQLIQPIIVWDFDRPRSQPLIIAAGTSNGIAVKNVTAVAAGQVVIVAWIDETPF